MSEYDHRTNRYEDTSDEETSVSNSYEDEDPEGPVDHVIPYSEHEEPRDISTRPNYTAPGEWAKPPPGRDIPLDFVPTKLYAQVRASHTIKRVPQEEAIEAAETKEEKENAARLREVVTNSKVATVYTEEGYEDSAYDHAGQVRDADFHEGYAKNLESQIDHKSKKKPGKVAKKKANFRRTKPNSKFADDYSDDYREHFDDSEAIEELESRGERKLVQLDEEDAIINNAEDTFKKELNNPQIHPKLVTEEGIEKLESDINYSNAESDKGSEIYGAEKLTRSKEDNDYDLMDPQEAKNLGKKNNLQQERKHESQTEAIKNLQPESTTQTVYTVRPRKKPDIRKSNSQKPYKGSRKFKEHDKKSKIAFEKNRNVPRVREEYEDTTYLAPQSTTNNPTEDFGLFTLGYSLATDNPTTVNYGEIFWRHFKERQNQRALPEPKRFQEETTINPDSITMASINGHGPYQVVNQNEILPSNPLGNLIATDLTNNLRNEPSSESKLLQRAFQTSQKVENNESLDGIVSNLFYPGISDSTEKLWNLGNDDSTMTPSYAESPVVANDFEPRRGKSHFDHNPFLIDYARSAKANIPRYTVLYRNHDNQNRRDNSISDQPLNADREDVKVKEVLKDEEYPLIQSDTKHKKMLHYLQNQRKVRPIKENVNTRSTQDFTFLKPPPPPPLSSREVTYNDFLPHSYASVIDHSTMTKRSRELEESGHRFSNNLPVNHVHVPQRLSINSPMVAHGKEMFLMLHLHPPSPFNRSKYAEYRVRNRRSENNAKVKSKKVLKVPTLKDPTAAKNIDVSRNNFRNIWRRSSLDKKRSKRNIAQVKKSVVDTAEPELILLNESPKITNEVINAEIETRFKNTKKDANDKNEETVSNENENENVEIEIPELNYEDELSDNNYLNNPSTTNPTFDSGKYPFYENDTISNSMTLKYIVNPERVPRKTFGGMEFYQSRNYLKCDEINPNLENVVPKEEEPVANRGLKENLPRLQGLGDKLDCFKAKYFDLNPLDNPLFLESQVEQPSLPVELKTIQFTSRILELPPTNDNYVSLHGPKKPDITRFKTQIDRMKKFQPRHDREPIDLVNIAHDSFRTMALKPETINARSPEMQIRRLYRVPKQQKQIDEGGAYVTSPYQETVYKDVISTLKNLGHMYDKVRPQSSISSFKTTLLPNTTQLTVTSTIKTPPLNLLYPNAHSQKFINHVPDLLRHKETGIPLVDITEKPYDSQQSNIKGLVPPAKEKRFFRIAPYRSRISYQLKTPDIHRLRKESEFLGYYRVKHLKKRSTRSTHVPTTSFPKKFKRSVSDSPLESFPEVRAPFQRKKKTSTLKSDSTETEASKPQNETKKIYTINDRIRHSKPKDEYGKHGRFTTEPVPLEIDSRRQEPRYNPIKQRSASVAFPVSTSVPTEINISSTILPPGSSNLTIIYFDNQNKTANEQEEDATINVEYPLQHKKRKDTDLSEESNEKEDKKSESKYDVYEVTSEENPDTELIEHLRSDLPRYDKAVSESDDAKESDHENDSSKLEEHEEHENKEEIEDDTDDKGNLRDDSSSENSEEYTEDSSSEAEDEKQNDDQTSSEKPKDINEDDKTFERFDSRPFSPPENFEDDKYADLGPRINKPAFHHPPFIIPEYEKSHLGRIIDQSDSEQSEVSGESQEYVLPWEEDDNTSKEEEDEKEEESRHFSRIIGRYEYPWEKRDRLAKEKRHEKHENQAKLGKQRKFLTDSDANEARSDQHKRYAYSWDQYTVPSKNYMVKTKSNFWGSDSTFKNDEATTKYPSVTKLGNRDHYLPFNDIDSPASVSDKMQDSLSRPLPQESVKSSANLLPTPKGIKKLLIVADNKKFTLPITTSSPMNRRTFSLNILPELVTNTPIRNQESIKRSKRKQIRDNKSLRVDQTDLDKRSSQIKAVDSKSSSSTTVDPASRTIRRRKMNSEISKIGKADVKPTNTTKMKNRRRGRLNSTTISPKVTVLSKVKTTYRRSPTSRFPVGDKSSIKNVSSDIVSSLRSISSTEDNVDFGVPTPTSRKIEHRSRVSKEEIITKSVYPSEDMLIDENKNISDNEDGKLHLKEIGAPLKRMRINRQKGLKDSFMTNDPATEKVEKVSITMNKTPDHIYQPKEIDKDGVKETRVMIGALKNSSIPINHKEDVLVNRSKNEEINRQTDETGTNFGNIRTIGVNEAIILNTTLPSNVRAHSHIYHY